MPIAKDGTGLDDRGGNAQLNKDDEDRRDRNRRRGVHHDTQGAMLGVAGRLVQMRNLHDRQQRDQDQAHQEYGRERPRPGTCAAGLEPESCQIVLFSFSLWDDTPALNGRSAGPKSFTGWEFIRTLTANQRRGGTV